MSDLGATEDADPQADDPTAASATELGADDTPAADATDSPEDAPGFQNRASRRAKGKGAEQHQTPGNGGNLTGHGPVPARRQWGNRRTG